MRYTLENMQRIDQYITGSMTPSDKIAFESDLKNNPELFSNYQDQVTLVQGIHRMDTQFFIHKAAARFALKMLVIKALIAIVIAGLIGVAVFSIQHSLSTSPQEELGSIEMQSFQPEDRLEAIVFTIDNSKTQTVETPGGLVFSLLPETFVDSTGKAVIGQIELHIKEVLTTADILTSGLTTKTAEGELETAGMFQLLAYSGNSLLKIAPDKSIAFALPTDSIRTDMHLYTGVKDSTGALVWTNPQPLDSIMPTVNVEDLDFYPPGYMDHLTRKNLVNERNAFSDSLYFNLIPTFTYSVDESNIPTESTPRSERNVLDTITPLETFGTNKKLPAPEEYDYSDTIEVDYNWEEPEPVLPGIDPSVIKSIWSPAFNNTLIATHAFERRLQFLHTQCGSAALEELISHLDWPLQKIDRAIANNTLYTRAIRNQFQKFALERCGAVPMESSAQAALNEYLAEKTAMNRQLAQALSKKVKQKEHEQLARWMEAQRQRQAFDNQQMQAAHQEEYNELLTQVAKEINYTIANPIASNVTATRTTYYRGSIERTGWLNVDAQVAQAIQKRKTTMITNVKNGEQTTLTFVEYTLHIQNAQTYDHVMVYCIPNKMTTFLRMDKKENNHSISLSDRMKYEYVVVAYRKNEMYTTQGALLSPSTSVHLNATSKEEFEKNCSRLMNAAPFQSVLEHTALLMEENAQRKSTQKVRDAQELRRALTEIVWPCVGVVEARILTVRPMQ